MPIFCKSRKKEIGPEDLYSALKDHKSDTLGDAICAAWDKEQMSAKKKGREPSLLKASLCVFGWRIVMMGSLVALFEILLK